MELFSISSIVRENIKKLKPYQIKEVPFKIKLDANELPFNIQVSDIVDKVDIFVNRYPDPEVKRLRKLISKRLKVNPNSILVGNGSDELIYYLITTFGGPVVYPTPTFAMYGIISDALGVKKFECPLDENFDLDYEKLEKTIIKKKPHLIFLSSPNNPTGNSFSSDKILKTIETARQNNAIVVIDEAYQPFCSNKGFLSFVRDFDNLVILRTLSKIGLAGLRVGYLIAKEEIIKEINKVRLPYNVDALSQYIAEKALSSYYKNILKYIGEIKKERDRLFRELSKIRVIKVFPSEANFILFRVKNAEKINKELIKRGILIRNLSPYVKDALRVTVGTKEENNEFLKALKEILEV